MIFYRFMRFFVVGYTRVVYRVRVVGREHAPATGPYIIAPSHRSMLDIPLAGAITTRRIRFMGKSSLFRIPVLGAIFRALGGFPVERDGSDVGPLRDSLRILESGEPLVVYPEGSRQRGREIVPLQPGAAWLAARSGVPIVPVGIAGAEETFRTRNNWRPRFGRIVVVVGEPILPPVRGGSAVKRSAVDDLTATLHERLQKLLDEAYSLRGLKTFGCAVKYEEPPAELWVDDRATVGRSAIEGDGLFAVDAVRAGTILIRLAGRLVSSAELSELIVAANADPGAPYVDCITVYEDAHLVLPSGGVVHFGNHSCDPNLWHVGPYEIAARRDIGAGEELTVDYATSSGASGFSMTCSCGSALCRGEISSEDWRRPDLQERYRGHWVPALQERISRL